MNFLENIFNVKNSPSNLPPQANQSAPGQETSCLNFLFPIIAQTETDQSMSHQPNLESKNRQKRKREEEDSKTSLMHVEEDSTPIQQIKKPKVETSRGTLKKFPDELLIQVFSFLEKKDNLNLKLVNSEFKSIINGEEIFYRKQQHHILEQFLDNLIHSKTLAPYNISDKLLQIKESIDTKECFENIRFDLKNQFSVVEKQLINLLVEVDLEELFQLYKELKPIPLGFDHFFDSLVLLKIFNEYLLILPKMRKFIQNPTPSQPIKKLLSFFLFHLQMNKIVEDKKFKDIHQYFQQVVEFDPQQTDKLHPRALELINLFNEDQEGTNSIRILDEILNGENELNLTSDYLFLEAGAKIYQFLNFFKHFEKAQSCLESLMIIMKGVPLAPEYNRIFNEIDHSFTVLINYNRMDYIESAIKIIDSEIRFSIIVNERVLNVTTKMHKADKIEDILTFITHFDSYLLANNCLTYLLRLKLSHQQVIMILRWALIENTFLNPIIFECVSNSYLLKGFVGVEEIRDFAKQHLSSERKEIAIKMLIDYISNIEQLNPLQNILDRLNSMDGMTTESD